MFFFEGITDNRNWVIISNFSSLFKTKLFLADIKIFRSRHFRFRSGLEHDWPVIFDLYFATQKKLN